MKLTFDVWQEAVLKTVSASSRTAQGETSTAYDGTKPALQQEGVSLSEITKRNLASATEYIWQHGQHARMNKRQVRQFIDAVAQKVSAGLLKPSQGLYRTWSTVEKYPQQTLPQDIEVQYATFCCVVAMELKSTKHLVTIAAFVERELNWRIHPFADGCGRTAKLLGAWVLLRAGKLPARPSDFETYYVEMNKDFPGWLAYYRSQVTEAA